VHCCSCQLTSFMSSHTCTEQAMQTASAAAMHGQYKVHQQEPDLYCVLSIVTWLSPYCCQCIGL
jgi:hypothetical protein